MSTIEELQRDCAYCRQPITLKWKNGPMRSEGVRLVVDQVFHDECWDKFFAVLQREASAPSRRGRTTAAGGSEVMKELARRTAVFRNESQTE